MLNLSQASGENKTWEVTKDDEAAFKKHIQRKDKARPKKKLIRKNQKKKNHQFTLLHLIYRQCYKRHALMSAKHTTKGS